MRRLMKRLTLDKSCSVTENTLSTVKMICCRLAVDENCLREENQQTDGADHLVDASESYQLMQQQLKQADETIATLQQQLKLTQQTNSQLLTVHLSTVASVDNGLIESYALS